MQLGEITPVRGGGCPMMEYTSSTGWVSGVISSGDHVRVVAMSV